MPKHIFINSHDLDTSMIRAQLVNGKGRYTDIPGTCFGYKFEFPQLDRKNMPESIRSDISDEWLDAQNLIKLGEMQPGDINEFKNVLTDSEILIATGITEKDADLMNAMPEGTYFWNTRHVSEMFQCIDKIENAHIIQMIGRKYEPYFKLMMQFAICELGGDFYTSTIDTLLDEIVGSIQATNNCAAGLIQDGYGELITLVDYEVMYNAELFAQAVAPIIEVDVNRNKKVLADYLEENMGAIMHATDEEIEKVDWQKIDDFDNKIQSPVIKQEMKRAYLSDKKFFTETNNTNKRTVEDFEISKPRDWFDKLVSTLNSDFIDEEYQDMITEVIYKGRTSLSTSGIASKQLEEFKEQSNSDQ
jgi:hypothetical protein|tara:strand:+ start:2244 stop:3323 length:1080 start_codon:yes stop_codon:yes gene_type:complete